MLKLPHFIARSDFAGMRHVDGVLQIVQSLQLHMPLSCPQIRCNRHHHPIGSELRDHRIVSGPAQIFYEPLCGFDLVAEGKIAIHLFTSSP